MHLVQRLKNKGKFPTAPDDLVRSGMNGAGTDSESGTELTQRRSRPVRDPHKEREERQAWALQVVKNMRRSPSAPAEDPEPPLPEPTYLSDPGAPGWVYFAYCAGRIKIGYTTNVTNRMPQYSTHAPHPCTLLLAIGGDEEDERAYHAEFASDRLRGEWFRLSDDLRDFLDRTADDNCHSLLFEMESEYLRSTQAELAYITEIVTHVEKEIANARAPA